MREINETSAKSTSGNFTLTGNTTVNITKDLKFVGLASFSYISDHGENINGKNTIKIAETPSIKYAIFL